MRGAHVCDGRTCCCRYPPSPCEAARARRYQIRSHLCLSCFQPFLQGGAAARLSSAILSACKHVDLEVISCAQHARAATAAGCARVRLVWTVRLLLLFPLLLRQLPRCCCCYVNMLRWACAVPEAVPKPSCSFSCSCMSSRPDVIPACADDGSDIGGAWSRYPMPPWCGAPAPGGVSSCQAYVFKQVSGCSATADCHTHRTDRVRK